MAEMNPSGGRNSLKDQQLIAIYEQLRAAEKNGSNDDSFTEWSIDVDIDWDGLERRVLQPSLPERIRDFCFAIAPRALAFSIIGPAAGLLGTFFWLRAVPVDLTFDFAMKVVVASVVMVLMFIWAALAMQALHRLAQRAAQQSALRQTPEPAFTAPSRFLLSPRAMTAGFFVATVAISTSVMGMATAPQWRWLHPNTMSLKVSTIVDGLSGPRQFSIGELRTDDVPGEWTRRAELCIRRSDLREARLALRTLETAGDVPVYERARADVLLGYIDAHQTWQELLAAPRAPVQIRGISRLDRSIHDVAGASETLGSDARVLLSYLYLARAAATDDPAERAKWREEALRFSLHALDAARVVHAKDVR